jgi:ABC-type sugar transport system, periplasmic component
LQRGEYAWISCSSMDIQTLKKSMGRRLGVSPLPNGRHHVASPINQIRVLALGRDSSARQREASLRFLNYIAQPQVQRDLSLRSFSFLPVNPFVTVPVESSSILRSMVTAREQAADSQPSLSIISSYGEASRSIQTLLVPLIFGVSTPEETADALIKALQQEVQP